MSMTSPIKSSKLNHEPIIKCRKCRGEGIQVGPLGPRACNPCKGTGLRAILPAKRCGCGASYTTLTWQRLPFVGTMEDDVETIELRNCACGSTLAIVVDRADCSLRVPTHEHAQVPRDRCECDGGEHGSPVCPVHEPEAFARKHPTQPAPSARAER